MQFSEWTLGGAQAQYSRDKVERLEPTAGRSGQGCQLPPPKKKKSRLGSEDAGLARFCADHAQGRSLVGVRDGKGPNPLLSPAHPGDH